MKMHWSRHILIHSQYLSFPCLQGVIYNSDIPLTNRETGVFPIGEIQNYTVTDRQTETERDTHTHCFGDHCDSGIWLKRSGMNMRGNREGRAGRQTDNFWWRLITSRKDGNRWKSGWKEELWLLADQYKHLQSASREQTFLNDFLAFLLLLFKYFF